MRRVDVASSYDLINELVDLDRIEGFVRQEFVIDGTPSRRDFEYRIDEVMGDAVKILVKEPIIDHINIKTLNEYHRGEKLSIHLDYSYSIDYKLEGIKEQYLSALFWFNIREIRKLTREQALDVSEPPPMSKWSQERYTPLRGLFVQGETYVVSERVLRTLRSIAHESQINPKRNVICDIAPHQGSYFIVDERATEDYVMHLPKTTVWVSRRVNVMLVDDRSLVFTHEQSIDTKIEYPVTKIIGL